METILIGSSRSKWLEGMFGDGSMNIVSNGTKPNQNQKAKKTQFEGWNSGGGVLRLRPNTKANAVLEIEKNKTLEEYAFALCFDISL